MRKYIFLAVLLWSIPAGAVNWTFTDNVTVQENLTVMGTATFTEAPVFTDNTLNGVDLLDNTVASGKILDNSILTEKIADGTIRNADIADNTIASEKMLDNTIALGKIAHTGTASSSTFLRGDASWAGGIGQLSGFKNLKIATPADDQSVTITADKVLATDSSDTSLVLSTVSLTVDLDATGANGLDTGSLAADTGYFLYVISNSTTTAGLGSTSATAPSMPSGYTFKALVGWCTTDATGTPFNINEFTQVDDVYHWTVGQKVIDNGGTTNTATLNLAAGGALSYAVVPPTITKGIFGKAFPNGASQVIYMAPATFGNSVNIDSNTTELGTFLTATGGAQWSINPLVTDQTIYYQNTNNDFDAWITGFTIKR